jgi:hypothetical protein
MIAVFLATFARAAEPVPSPNTLTSNELSEGWILLFDGQSLFGWSKASEADWKVADGMVRVGDGQPGLLHTATQFADYELKVDFRAAEGTRSGVFLRTSPKPAGPASGCYAVGIAAASGGDFSTGSLVGRKKAAPVKLDGDWHQLHITANGNQFVVRFDGSEVLQYEDARPLGRGFIGLQYDQGRIDFRSIKLRPLGMQPIFNSKDLSGWTVYPDKQSRFGVTKDGSLNIKDGPGQIETVGQYGDFVLQTEIFVNGKELNSGIFFRCIPGDFQMGYESQIHNGFVGDDRNQPNNGGTGGIFRRQVARRVVADDFTWFHKTIVCDDRHMAVWVNGIQVSDWTDTRPPHENPRKGRRLEKGTIILQGHDPTTDLSFRNMRIAEIAERR